MTLIIELLQYFIKVNSNANFHVRTLNGSTMEVLTDWQTDGTDSITPSSEVGGNYACQIRVRFLFQPTFQLTSLIFDTTIALIFVPLSWVWNAQLPTYFTKTFFFICHLSL